MFNNPMSPESVRIVHEREIREAAVRNSRPRLIGMRQERPALRLVVGSALIRVGWAIASGPIAPAAEGQPRHGHLRLLPHPNEGAPECKPSS